MTTILASASPGERRTVLVDDDGNLVELHIERPGRPDGVGDLHRARVSALAPAMAGAFLAMAGGETGFLPESAVGPARQPIGRSVSEGQMLAVRITRAAQGGKGPRLTARLTPEEATRIAAAPGTGPALIARGPDAATRLARAHLGAAIRTDSPSLAARLRIPLSHRPVLDDALEAELDLLAGPEVPLPGGGRLLVHPTPALTAIDVDAGSAAGTRDPQAQLRLNQAAVAEAARQIRLRNLAGPILLDLAGLTVKRREALAEPLRAALATDPLAQLRGLGPLGLFEILRQRIQPPLHEVLGWPPSPLTHGLAALRRAAREAAARPGRRWALRAHPAVLGALRDLPGALAEAEAALGTPLHLHPDPALAPAQSEIEEAAHG
ncbi:ribonuclease E/G [Paracraurococcus lichenis]|uniref:Ribonuclease E/G n=1 Tax=Paracraurococcus lichenis TaxID=3064888 RepID=A0ABT9E1N5_9PROT|nr:ribonuclease E/G [Paracraurococcus sp. LOR1-02]MDO9710044.1 ribonuclease E/G [Paracraurococcus sp. LOR1-02]